MCRHLLLILSEEKIYLMDLEYHVFAELPCSTEFYPGYNDKGEPISATNKGKKINPKKTYIVATIDYLANGGDYMTPMTRCKRLFVDTQKYGNHILNYVKNLQANGKKINGPDEVRIKKK